MTADGKIGVRRKKTPIENILDDLEFHYLMPEQKADMEKIALEKEAYDFVQSSLHNAAANAPCALYIEQAL